MLIPTKISIKYPCKYQYNNSRNKRIMKKKIIRTKESLKLTSKHQKNVE